MEKKANRKLTLHRETLQQLDAVVLGQARGGQTPIETVVRPTDACPVKTA